MLSKYNPDAYWEDRGVNYPFEEHQHKYPDFPGRKELRRVFEILAPISSLLDLGCGSGRLFDLYTEIPRVIAVDGSSTMLKHAEKRRDELGLKNIELKLLKAQNLSELGEKIEVVLTRNVLMHVKPEDIVQVIHGIKEVAEKRVILVEYAPKSPPPLGLAPHNFVHDYEALFSDWGCEMARDVEGDTLYVFKRRD